jgi:hypothetical protein
MRIRNETSGGAILAAAAGMAGPALAQDGALAGRDVAFVLWGCDGYQQGQGN